MSEQKTSQTLQVKFKLLSAVASAPTHGSQYAAGWDLYSPINGTIAPKSRLLIKTDVSIQVPTGLYGRIAPRSSLAYKYGIDVLAGVCDSDYRGNYGIILINHGDNPFNFKCGDRIAQLIFEKYDSTIELIQCNYLDESNRGDGGFGSSGV